MPAFAATERPAALRAFVVAVAFAALLTAGPGRAFPDGAPWEAAAAPEGCNQCHFDASATDDSRAVEIAGLPASVDAGALYRLTLSLSADAMGAAGFLLTALENGEPAGRFEALDERTSVQAAQARSTKAGAKLTKPGLAEWTVSWVAPPAPDGAVSFELWANAANDDQSPFGDATHFRAWRVATHGNPDR